ncbi:hypothetical protein BDZ91DRAFT_757428 [Kalaharituber pfeilii]|nr:hypothetical protein BDZ91DRAFT_757428 [Kalaharituber pfeilii]
MKVMIQCQLRSPHEIPITPNRINAIEKKKKYMKLVKQEGSRKDKGKDIRDALLGDMQAGQRFQNKEMPLLPDITVALPFLITALNFTAAALALAVVRLQTPLPVAPILAPVSVQYSELAPLTTPPLPPIPTRPPGLLPLAGLRGGTVSGRTVTGGGYARRNGGIWLVNPGRGGAGDSSVGGGGVLDSMREDEPEGVCAVCGLNILVTAVVMECWIECYAK